MYRNVRMYMRIVTTSKYPTFVHTHIYWKLLLRSYTHIFSGYKSGQWETSAIHSINRFMILNVHLNTIAMHYSIKVKCVTIFSSWTLSKKPIITKSDKWIFETFRRWLVMISIVTIPTRLLYGRNSGQIISEIVFISTFGHNFAAFIDEMQIEYWIYKPKNLHQYWFKIQTLKFFSEQIFLVPIKVISLIKRRSKFCPMM